MKLFISFLKQRPSRLLVLDALGAGLSLIGLLIHAFHPDFSGLSTGALLFLASFPAIFILFDVLVLWYKKNLGYFIRVIGFCNWAYGILSLTILVIQAPVVSPWGWIYFITEIIIVWIIATFELKYKPLTEAQESK